MGVNSHTHGGSPDQSSAVPGGQFNRHAAWSLFAIAAPKNVAGVRTAFAEETARVRRDGGFSAEELQRAKDAIASASRLARAQDASLASALEHDSMRDRMGRAEFLADQWV